MKKGDIATDEVVLRIVESMMRTGYFRNEEEIYMDKDLRDTILHRAIYLYEYGRRIYPDVGKKVEEYFKRTSAKKIIETITSVDQVEMKRETGK